MTQEQKNFIEKVGSFAAADMKNSGVLASLTIAQAILESGWGKSGLTVKGNALFGIKATASWKGKVYSGKTQECFDGVSFTEITACFRAYDSWADSVADHSALLTGTARYKAVVSERDYKTACRAVKAAGYATDPGYAEKLISLIEQYGLAKYDTASLTPSETNGTASKTAEQQLREKAVNTAIGFYGLRESDGSHKAIIDAYNAAPPLARGYKMSYTDAWCACFVSVVAIKASLLDIMPKEVGCGKMIELYQKIGRWQENDAYIPKSGDIIFYDWQDSGTGDNVGAPDHVGIVVSVSGGTIKVIEGNISNAVGYRNIAVNGKMIRGFGLPDYAKLASGTSSTATAPTQKPIKAPQSVKVGDVVQFTGGAVYTSANATKATTTRNASCCKVTQTYNGAHPYHLISTDGKGVYGWVDADNITK
jgi:Muramidase (flagellum-specific)